ncbi:hypothetical protein EWJ82_19970 [Salmonella enterica subsp. enterica serovar Weybridge]|nr:hypothetical protein [Salmonella enterica subsp. enterica serovar Weybridge]
MKIQKTMLSSFLVFALAYSFPAICGDSYNSTVLSKTREVVTSNIMTPWSIGTAPRLQTDNMNNFDVWIEGITTVMIKNAEVEIISARNGGFQYPNPPFPTPPVAPPECRVLSNHLINGKWTKLVIENVCDLVVRLRMYPDEGDIYSYSQGAYAVKMYRETKFGYVDGVPGLDPSGNITLTGIDWSMNAPQTGDWMGNCTNGGHTSLEHLKCPWNVAIKSSEGPLKYQGTLKTINSLTLTDKEQKKAILWDSNQNFGVKITYKTNIENGSVKLLTSNGDLIKEGVEYILDSGDHLIAEGEKPTPGVSFGTMEIEATII